MRVAEMNKLFRVFGIVAVQVIVAELEHQPPAQKGLHLCAAELAVKPLRQQQRDVA